MLVGSLHGVSLHPEVLAGSHTRLDTPPSSNRHHPGSRIAPSGAGGTLTISSDGEAVMVGSGETMATVVTPDLTLGDVTIHLIDTAFLPQ